MTEIFHYPDDLEALVISQWPAQIAPDPLAEFRRALLEVAYHASMLREEGRPVRVRVALARAPATEAEALPVARPLVLRFDRSRPFHVDELRRLAVAAPFETAVVAVEPDARGELRIWGILTTGAQWLAPTWGGRSRADVALPKTVVHVRGPARISVHAGDHFVAGLEGGRLLTLRTDVFASRWMPALFAGVRHELVEAHAAERPEWPALHESLVRSISQQMVRRALWLMREAHHGGTILFVEPDERGESLFRTLFRAKYQFAREPARARYRALLRAITWELARSRPPGAGAITADDFYERSHDLAEVESAVFELSRTLASLSAVDGAVVLSKRFELLAFGVEIAPANGRAVHDVTRIHRALDTEGEVTIEDDEENVGTRHRAAYRFVQAHPTGLAIVASQDGTIRFVASHDGRVTYYEQHVAG